MCLKAEEMENNNNKNEKIEVRVSKLEKEYIHKKAKSIGYKNSSEYIRNSIITPENHNRVAMRGMVYEVNKIGVNLMQITKHCNTYKEIDIEVLQALMTMQEQLEEVLKTYKDL
jgi:hypothetical protein